MTDLEEIAATIALKFFAIEDPQYADLVRTIVAALHEARDEAWSKSNQ